MPKTILFVSSFLYFLSCSVKSNKGVLFDLITQSEIHYIYEFYDCKLVDESSEIAFFRIRNNQADTIYATVYYKRNIPFLIIDYASINFINNGYVIAEKRFQPFYPPGHTDTIMPFQNKIYPVYLPEIKFNKTGYFLITPSLFAKEFKVSSYEVSSFIHDVKTPSVVYKIENDNLIDWTEEVNN